MKESQENSPFPAGDRNTARHRQDNMAKTNYTNKKTIHERSTALEWLVRKLLEGLNLFHSTNLPLILNDLFLM